MKLSLAKTFLLILISAIILLTLIIAGNSGMPEPLPTIRVILGIIFVLLVPGYALQSVLFPHHGELDSLLRLAYSFGLSIAVLPPIFLILNTLGLGVRFPGIAVALGILVLICAAIALFRQWRSTDEEKSGIAFSLDIRGWWASQDRTSRWLYGILGLALSSAAVSAILVSREKPGEHFTEFYILDAQGLSMDYPREVAAGQPIVFNLGIANHEGERSQYKIVVARSGEQALATAGPISLAAGETWEGSVAFELTQSGSGQQINFLLERVGSPWPYRTLMVWLNVDAPEESIACRLNPFPSGTAERNPRAEGFPWKGLSKFNRTVVEPW
jgi:uncharacterized membrane protein